MFNRFTFENKQSKTIRSANKQQVDIALLAAMPEELAYFEDKFKDLPCEIVGSHFKIYDDHGRKILTAATGFGTTFAASVYSKIIADHDPLYTIVVGSAGGIQKNLNFCDVVIVDEVFEAEIQGAFQLLESTPFESALIHPLKSEKIPGRYRADTALLSLAKDLHLDDVKIHVGKAVSSNQFPSPLAMYKNIKEQNALTMDMESSAFCQTGWLYKKSIICIRGISNLLDHDGTDEDVHKSDLSGSARAACKVADALMKKIFLQPKNIVDTKSSEVEAIIKAYKLQPHPEGGYFAQTFRAEDLVTPQAARYQHESRPAGTSIYFLLDKKNFSAWHVLRSDEVWNHHRGSTVLLHVINKNGELSTKFLGDPLDDPRASHQVVIKAGEYFAAENADPNYYSLVGCNVNPGFEYPDFELCHEKNLIQAFPQHQAIIKRLTHESHINPEVKDKEEASRVVRRF